MNLCRKKDFALVVAAALSHAALYQPVVAQQAPMALEWERNDRPDFRSDGLNYAHNGTAWTTTPTPLPVDDFGSGKDWFYALTKIYAPPTTPGGPLGAHIAYVAVGYVGWANWSGLQNGCNAATPPAADFEFPYHMGTGANAPGKLRMGMAYYDLDGTLIWYKAYYSDVLNGVTRILKGISWPVV